MEVLFGEWLWARHSVAYTKLPAYFVAFDIYNKRQGAVWHRPAGTARAGSPGSPGSPGSGALPGILGNAKSP